MSRALVHPQVFRDSVVILLIVVIFLQKALLFPYGVIYWLVVLLYLLKMERMKTWYDCKLKVSF